MTTKKKIYIAFVVVAVIITAVTIKYELELKAIVRFYVRQKPEFALFEAKKSRFTLNDGGDCKLINSAIKENYQILFNGDIIDFDTLFIGKGVEKWNASYILIDRDSIVFNTVARVKSRIAYEHNLRLKGRLSIVIDRKLGTTAMVTVVNDGDTLKIASEFIGMDHPFVRSIGSSINVDEFEFKYDDYSSDIFLFGDSYVNCYSASRWPYYVYNKGYRILCDGLPGGYSVHSWEFVNSALSVRKPKYLIWCLGMNDGSDKLGTNLDWKYYAERLMSVCESNNITLIFATIPSVPTRDNSGKNEYIRNSGYRFIDFDKAVSDGKGNWKHGLLSDDGVHPTEAGAKAMADVFLNEVIDLKLTSVAGSAVAKLLPPSGSVSD